MERAATGRLCCCQARQKQVFLLTDSQSKREGYSANSYIQVLEEVIPTCWEPSLIFMQDNAPIHKAGKVKKWFADQGIPLLDWPPYSPDLNPIEHCWVHMKQWILDNYPELQELGESQEAYDRLAMAI